MVDWIKYNKNEKPIMRGKSNPLPLITIEKNGMMRLNKTAFGKTDKMRNVDLYFEKTENNIALHFIKNSDRTEDTLKMSSTEGRNIGLIAAKRFLNNFNISINRIHGTYLLKEECVEGKNFLIADLKQKHQKIKQ